ncbi:MAG: PD-(D/E)XK nuclease family protein [Candidatus Woesearchaeota archaeon]
MPYTLSPTTLALYEECPTCFWLHMNKGIKRPAGIFPSLPSGMDSIFKKYFDFYMEQGTLPPFLANVLPGCKLFDNKLLLKEWRNTLKGIQWKDAEGNVLKGAVDNLLIKDEKLIVLDYKTRGYALKEDTATHYQQQLNLYNFLLRKNGYATEEYALLLFYYPKEVNTQHHLLPTAPSQEGQPRQLATLEQSPETETIIFETRLITLEVNITHAEQLVSQALALLAGKQPGPNPECEYCRYRTAGN